MARFAFVFDQTRCIGCNACQMACIDKNNLEKGMYFRRADTMEVETSAGKVWMHYSGSCNHCKKPACVSSCPTGAMHICADGTVGHTPEKCIGCGSCTWACPYGAPRLSHRHGIAMKCNSCADERALGRNPACVDACLTHCLSFVDMDTLSSEEKAACTSSMPFLPDPALTEPSLLILAKEGGIRGE